MQRREAIDGIERIEEKLGIERIAGLSKEEIYERARRKNEISNISRGFITTFGSILLFSSFDAVSPYSIIASVAAGCGVYCIYSRKEERLWKKKEKLEKMLKDLYES